MIDGGAGTDVVAGTAGGDVLDLSGTELRGIEQIDGGAGNDRITGTAAADTIIGGAGYDTLAGGEGDDTFLVAGTDAAYDLVSGGAGLDTIVGSDGDDTIRLHSFQGDNTVEVIDGGPGTNVVAGTAGGDVLDLSATELRGIEQIDGGAGNDRITGTAAADTIIGGAGYDTLAGGEGDDTYLFSAGWGGDVVKEDASTAGGTDRIAFEDVLPSDLLFSHSGSDLVIGRIGAPDTVTLRDWTTNGGSIESIEAGNEAAVTNAAVDQLIQAMTSFGATHGDISWEEAITTYPDETQAMLASYWQAGVA